MSGPHVLDDGSVVVPAGLTALVGAAIQRAARDGMTIVDLHPVLTALAEGARICRERRTVIERAMSAQATAAQTPRYAGAQLAPDSVKEISTAHTAGRLRLSPQRVRRLVSDGRLAGRKVGRDLWITVESVEHYEGVRHVGTNCPS